MTRAPARPDRRRRGLSARARTDIQACSFLPPAGLGVYAWAALGTPGNLGGLGAAILMCGLAWPCLVAFCVFGLPPLLLGAVPGGAPRRAAKRKAWKDAGYERAAIPAWMVRAVKAAGRNRCTYCRRTAAEAAARFGCKPQIHVDHVRPYAAGGLASLGNLYTLCAYHNGVKSDYWVHPSGYVQYHPYTVNNPELAAAVLRAERLARWNPLRWPRALAAL